MSAGGTQAEAVAAFERLARMIEHELELAGRGAVAELLAAVQERDAYVATLPSPAPPAARAAVVRAGALHRRVIIETERVRDALARSRASMDRAHRVARSYARKPRPRYFTSA